MSTRWQIAAKLTDGRCGCIYVHFDGYPSSAMNMLQKHYTDQEKIDKLISLGDCRSVSAELTDCDPYKDRKGEDWEDIKPDYGDDLKAVADKHQHGDEEYRYTWDGKVWTMEKLKGF